jgi:hypothetical protein
VWSNARGRQRQYLLIDFFLGGLQRRNVSCHLVLSISHLLGDALHSGKIIQHLLKLLL